MALTAADFKIRYPEFDSVEDTRIDLYISDADTELSESCFGDLYERAVFALAAHFLALDIARQDSGSGGMTAPLQSRSIGDVSWSHAIASVDSAGDQYLGSTQYGQEFMRLSDLSSPGAVVVQ
jgi:hypothetical protein